MKKRKEQAIERLRTEILTILFAEAHARSAKRPFRQLSNPSTKGVSLANLTNMTTTAIYQILHHCFSPKGPESER